ncbi:MAG TPA: Maf family nucleotide pyrophosphatase [Telmatospirillum sp.]|nr:Maf family nucleotide pyrophosphatase [Telmatospirillum sp.]
MTSADIPPVLLASASRTRQTLLHAAGVPVSAIPVDLDEQAMKVRLRADGVDAGDVAQALAQAKALAVAQTRPDALVIGADQILVCEDDWYDKPRDLAAARQQLRSLSGKTHRLLTAVVVVQETQLLWGHISQAAMTMRPFTETFLDDYLARGGPALLSSVGAYQLEGLGAQLFERIDGDHFTILGLPLLPLLDFLRRHGVIKT